MNPATVVPMVGALVATPVVTALVQAIKMTGVIPARFLPLLSVVIGTALGGAGYLLVQDPLHIVAGFTAGLAASGFYDTMTKTIER